MTLTDSEKAYMLKFTKKQVLRAFYDCIDAHEKQGLDTINLAWLRDYVDDIAVHFPEDAETLEND